MRHAKALAIVAALCAYFAIGAAPAIGAYGVAGHFASGGPGEGGSGSEAGFLSDPGQIAVNDATGNVYVADTGNDRVQVFKPAGGIAEYDSQAAITAPTGLAIDQVTGAVYVATPSGIAKLDSSLNPAAGWTDPGVTGALAVDPSSGDLLVADTAANLIRRYKSDGTAAGSFAAERPVDLAVNSAGEVLVVTTTGDIVLGGCEPDSTVVRFSAAGTELGEIGAALDTPAQVAIDPDDDSIAIATKVDKYFCFDELGVPEVVLLSAGGDLEEAVSLPQDTLFGDVPGLAVQGGGSDRVYAVTKSPLDDSFGATQVVAIQEITPPEAAIDPVDPADVAATTAAVSGSVDPNGEATSWRFEYREAGSNDPWSPGSEQDAGEGEDPVPVDAQLTGLTAVTEYEVRLVASNEDGEATAGPVTFTTLVGPPAVAPLSADQITPSSARLRATLSAGGLETTYFVEFGDADCSDDSCALLAGSQGALGAEVMNRTIRFTATGLEPQTTYHYRFVAENAQGRVEGPNRSFTTPQPVPPLEPPQQQPCSNAAIRAAQGSTFLPDCRAFEQVSPNQKYNGGVIFGQRVSDDGEAAGYKMNTPVSDLDAGFPAEGFVSRRGPNGWTTVSTTLPMRAENRGTGGITATVSDYTEDFRHAIYVTNDPIDPEDDEPTANGGGLTDGGDAFKIDLASRDYEWLSRPHPGEGTMLPAGRLSPTGYGGSSPDGRVVVFSSERPLVAGAPSTLGLYQWADGVVSLVSVLPDETLVSGQLATAHGQVAPAHGNHAISDDGSRIYWTHVTGTDSTPLYLRQDGELTVPVSASRRSTDLGTMYGSIFLGATRDGSRAYFWSASSLTEDAAPGGGVYLYEANTDDLTYLFAAEGVLRRDGSGYTPVLSESNERLYFLADDELVPGAEPGRNLYFWDDGELEHVAAVSDNTIIQDLRLRVSRDGRYAAFSSTKPLDPRHGDGLIGIYRYDAETEGIECASCGPAGSVTKTNALFRVLIPRFTALYTGQLNMPRNIADDGSVFFQTDDALVAGDVNAASDVYKFDGSSARLISTGRGQVGSEIADNSDDGSSVFFLTPESLASSDRDGGYPDLYVARVGGGFPEAPPSPPVCGGDGCQGSGSGEPAKPGLATAAVDGNGNADRSATKSLRVLSRRQLSANAVQVRVRVPEAGVIAVSGKLVEAARKRTSRPRAVALRVALNKKGRAALAGRRPLKAKTTLAFTPPGGKPATRPLTLTFGGGER